MSFDATEVVRNAVEKFADKGTLWSNVSCTITILRCLPPLARQYVFRLVFLNHPVDASTWTYPQPTSNPDSVVDDVLNELRRLGMLNSSVPTDNSKAIGSLELHPPFRDQLRRALAVRDSSPWKTQLPASDEESSVTPDFLHRWAHLRWESVLHFMVSPDEEPANRPEANWKPAKEVRRELQRAGLMVGADKEVDDEGSAWRGVTRAGFQFLLMPRRAQVWQLAVSAAEGEGEAGGGALPLLLQLPLCVLGRACPAAALPKAHRRLLQVLVGLGLAYRSSDKAPTFYPTPLLVHLHGPGPGPPGAGGGDGAEDAAGEGGERCVLAESNFRVCAYTNSPVQMSILRLFVQVTHRFPHMVLGLLTRTSVRSALRQGISAAQMITYLQLHSHPQAEASGGVPETVADQLRFWEQESRRIRACPATAYHSFAAPASFKAAAAAATRLAREGGGAVYVGGAEGVVVAPEDMHAELAQRIREAAA